MESLRSMHPGPLSAAQYFRYHMLPATCGRSPVLSGQTLHTHVGDDADNCPSARLLPVPESWRKPAGETVDDCGTVWFEPVLVLVLGPEPRPSRRTKSDPELEPRRGLARRGISVDALLVGTEEINGPAFGYETHATLGARARLPTAIDHGTVDADESAAAAREDVGAWSKRLVESDRPLTGPRVIDECVLHDAAVFEADVDRRLSHQEQMGASSADSVPRGHAIELAVNDMSRDVVDDGGDVDRTDAVGRGRLEDYVRMIEVKCTPLASHQQFCVDEKVDPALAVAEQIEISSTTLGQQKTWIVGLHARDGHEKRHSR